MPNDDPDRRNPPNASSTRRFDPWRHQLLDGATGTELARRGFDIGLPLWSANALLTAPGRELLLEIHKEYVAAGAGIITANTFRCHRRSLAKAGLGHRVADLVDEAVSLAREAAAGQALVAGSMAPLEDCYRPDLVPEDGALLAEHSELAAHLASCGCDLLLVETMNTAREAVAAVRAAVATGLPTLVCFVCRADTRLLSGEALSDAADRVCAEGVAAVGVNCAPAPNMACCLARLASDVAHVAYANIGEALPDGRWQTTDAVDPEAYAAYAADWDAAIVGGCCGTTPSHIRRLAERT